MPQWFLKDISTFLKPTEKKGKRLRNDLFGKNLFSEENEKKPRKMRQIVVFEKKCLCSMLTGKLSVRDNREVFAVPKGHEKKSTMISLRGVTVVLERHLRPCLCFYRCLSFLESSEKLPLLKSKSKNNSNTRCKRSTCTILSIL